MKCKTAEKLVLRSFDMLLKKSEQEKLDKHLESCLSCQRAKKDYLLIIETLGKEKLPELRPYFWERLQPKLKAQRKFEAWSLWKQWSLRAIPLAFMIVFLVIGGLKFFMPPKTVELSQTEALLLRNINPLQESKTLLEQEGIEDKNMMLIFTAMEEKDGSRRYFP